MPLLTTYGGSDEDSDHDESKGIRNERERSHDLLFKPITADTLPNTLSPGISLSSTEESSTRLAGFPQCIGLTDAEQVRIPDEVRGPVSPSLEAKIASMAEKQRMDGVSINDTIQRNKEFRNPSIYEKLIEHCKIEEYGTNFPPSEFDPERWNQEGANHISVEELAEIQAVAMDKYQREKRAKGGADMSLDAKRKSRWETGPAKPVVTNLLAAKMTGQLITKIPSSGNLSKSTK